MPAIRKYCFQIFFIDNGFFIDYNGFNFFCIAPD